MLKVVFRLHAAAGHQGKSNADRCRALKSHFNIKVIILFQKTPVNDVHQVTPVFLPVFVCKAGGESAKEF